MYLLRSVNYAGETAADRKEQRWLEFTLFFFIIIIIGFVGSIFGFNAAGYRAEFHKQVTVQQDGKPAEITEKSVYVLPPLIKSYGSEQIEMKPFLGMTEPILARRRAG